MARKCVIVSDLHLGRGNGQEDFRWQDGAPRDDTFEQFCERVVALAGGERLTFVLNGDVIDFWELADDDELAEEDAYDAICRNLVFSPSRVAADPDAATAFTRRQLAMALDAHPGFVAGVRRLLAAPNIDVVYLFGNHDHAMVNPALQATFRERVGADGDAAGRFVFDFYYEEPELLLYVEHGNQFADDDSHFERVADWRNEALGYYALRFIWNRYQSRYRASQPSVCEILRFVVDVVRDRPNDEDLHVVQYLIDYFRAVTADGAAALVPKIVGGFGLDRLYDVWTQHGRPTSADAALAGSLSAAATPPAAPPPHVHVATPQAVDSPWPGDAVSSPTDYDQYTSGLIGRFTSDGAPFRRLDKTRHQLLFIGHTHRPGRQPLFHMTDGIERQLYINTGSWTTDNVRPLYGYVEATDRGVEAGLAELG